MSQHLEPDFYHRDEWPRYPPECGVVPRAGGRTSRDRGAVRIPCPIGQNDNRTGRMKNSDAERNLPSEARSLSDIAVRHEAKERQADARPQARKNRRRIGDPLLFSMQRVMNTLRIFRG